MKPRCDYCNRLFDFKEQTICAIKESNGEILFVECLECASEDRNKNKKIKGIKWNNYAIGTELILTK